MIRESKCLMIHESEIEIPCARLRIEAAKWSRLAADQGYATAQYYLGQRSGRSAGLCAGVHVVRIEAREIVSGRMTDAQLAEAQTLAREWMPTAQPRFPSDESSKIVQK